MDLGPSSDRAVSGDQAVIGYRVVSGYRPLTEMAGDREGELERLALLVACARRQRPAFDLRARIGPEQRHLAGIQRASPAPERRKGAAVTLSLGARVFLLFGLPATLP